MATDTTELKALYDEFLTKGIEKLEQLQKDTQMEDEHLANASSNIVIGAMQNSVKAYESIHRVVLLQKQALTEEKKTLDVASATAVRDAQSAQDLLNKSGQLSLMSKQELKVVADTAFVDEQKTQLGYSVTYNNRIKSLENYSDMIGNLGIGGFVISSDMWSTYFKMINDIFINSGDVPVNETITTPSNTALTKP